MARMPKKGIDFYSVDAGLFKSLNVSIILGKYGCEGYALYMYIVDYAFTNEGYYTIADDRFEFITSKELNLPHEKVKEMIEFMCRYEVFDINMYEKYKIITCTDIQQKYQLSVKARGKKKAVEVVKEYWLLDEEETEKYIYPQNLIISPGINTQKTGEKCHKEKEEKEREKEKSLSSSKKELIISQTEKETTTFSERENDFETNDDLTNICGNDDVCENDDICENDDDYKYDDDDILKISRAYTQNIGKITPSVSHKLKSRLKDVDAEVIVHAIERTADYGSNKPAYIYAIIDNYIAKGIKKLTQALDDEDDDNCTKTNKSYEEMGYNLL